eukprot:7822235-Pyramimonas_sp.AAC.1
MTASFGGGFSDPPNAYKSVTQTGSETAPRHPLNSRTGCAHARARWSVSTPNYSALMRHWRRQIERHFRH